MMVMVVPMIGILVMIMMMIGWWWWWWSPGVGRERKHLKRAAQNHPPALDTLLIALSHSNQRLSFIRFIWITYFFLCQNSYLVSFPRHAVGRFLLKTEKTLFGMFPSCSPSLNDFRTVFVFASGPFLPMAVILVSDFFCCNYNGDAAPKFDLVITYDWGVLLTHVQQFWTAF